MILDQDFYFADTKTVSEKILGKILFHKSASGKILSGRIVEVEAYLGASDPASHAYKGRKTDRTKTMYLAGGYSYVYLIYGMYNCLNFVTGKEGKAEAVLIRALEPVSLPADKVSKKEMHTNGPGKLCRCFSITREHNALKLWQKKSGLWVEDDGYKVTNRMMTTAPRIGVEYAGEAAQWPLRYYLNSSPWVSKK